MVKSSPSVRSECLGGCKMSSSLLVLLGDEHVINGREELGLWRVNSRAPYYDISSEIANESHNKISSTL